MTKFSKPHELSYVHPSHDVVAVPEGALPAQKKRASTLTVFAFIAALLGVFTFALLLPSVIALALGVLALVFSVKRNRAIGLSVAAILISLGSLVTGFATTGLVVGAMDKQPVTQDVLGYATDDAVQVQYQYDPVMTLPCDGDGICRGKMYLMNSGKMVCPTGVDVWRAAYGDGGTHMVGVEPVNGVQHVTLPEGERVALDLEYKFSPGKSVMFLDAPQFECF